MIDVKQLGGSEPLAFQVIVRDTAGETHHHVTLSRADYERLARDGQSPARCVHAAFRFLLEREPKEAILRHFDVSVIARYFPEFENDFPRYIAGDDA